jgi:type I restriction enzyme S subunit
MSAAISQKKDIPREIELDRSDWELVTFGDVAIKQNTAVDRKNMDVSRYVAGEHMGSEDLHLRQWGEVGEDYLGPAFTRRFSKGDILYGSRRTYLRKVAVAHFDGVTANTTFVIKANEDLILPKLLPFVMLSEGFAQHSIRNSKGSVNPYINWKDIANYEFLLPPKDQQAKLAELLWAADASVESDRALLSCCELLFKSIEVESFAREGKKSEGLLDVATIKRGKFTHRPRNEPRFYGGTIPFIQTSEVVNSGKFIREFTQTLNEEGLKISKMFPKGTIVMTIAANIGYVGILDFDSAFTDSLVGVTADKKIILQEYLYYYLSFYQPVLDRLAPESAQKNLSLDTMMSFKVSYPVNKSDQADVVKKLDQVLDAISSSREADFFPLNC